jgi:hypothetical protein
VIQACFNWKEIKTNKKIEAEAKIRKHNKIKTEKICTKYAYGTHHEKYLL